MIIECSLILLNFWILINLTSERRIHFGHLIHHLVGVSSIFNLLVEMALEQGLKGLLYPVVNC